MHHYPFHIPDFNLATRHLSDSEELAYRRMIDLYMDSEKPLLSDCLQIARFVRCDVADVRTVLADFFTEEDDGWHNGRCDREIGAYQARSQRAKENGQKGGKSKARKGSKGKPKPEPSSSEAPAKQPLSDSPPSGELTTNHEPRTSTSPVGEGVQGEGLTSSPADSQESGPEQKPRANKAHPITDAWLDSDLPPRYPHVNIRREFDRCQTWCEAKRTTINRRRFVNWINRIEPPPQTSRNGAATPTRQFFTEQ